MLLGRYRTSGFAFTRWAFLHPSEHPGFTGQVASPSFLRGNEPARIRLHAHVLETRMESSLAKSNICRGTEGAEWTSE